MMKSNKLSFFFYIFEVCTSFSFKVISVCIQAVEIIVVCYTDTIIMYLRVSTRKCSPPKKIKQDTRHLLTTERHRL